MRIDDLPQLPQLTARQNEVCRLFMRGLHQTEIAKRLGIHVSAVRKNLAKACARLDAGSVRALAAVYILAAVDRR